MNWSPDELYARALELKNFDESILPIDSSILQKVVDDPSNKKKMVCWPCGSYKTTLVRQFITKNWMDGIIYATSTMEEADRMAFDIAACIGVNNIFVLHSNIDIEDYKKFNDNPDSLKKRPVIITTHNRIVKDPPNIIYDKDGADGQRERKYIFVDEKPTFFESLSLTASDVYNIVQLSALEIDPQKPEKRSYSAQMARSRLRSNLLSESGLSRNLSMNIVKTLSGKSTTPYESIVEYDPVLNSNDIKRTVAYLRTEDWLDKIVNTVTKDDEYQVSEKESNKFYRTLSKPENSTLVVLDATGRTMVEGSPDWEIYEDDRFTFNFKGSVEILESSLTRRVGTSSYDSVINSLNQFVAEIEEVCKEHSKVLVVVWKNLKDEYTEPDLSTLSSDDEPSVKYNMTASTDDLPSYVYNALSDEAKSKVHVTYYQSGKTRSTNEYKDCTAIVLGGSFFIPISAIMSHNKREKAKTSRHLYSIGEIVQAIYRTSARVPGGKASVYFTSDWSMTFIDSLIEYIKADIKVSTSNIHKFCNDFNIKYTERSLKYSSYLYSRSKELSRDTATVFNVPDEERTNNFKRGMQNLLEDSSLVYQDLSGPRFSVIIKS